MKGFVLLLIIITAGITSCSSTNKIPFEKRLIIAVGNFQNRSGDKLYDELMYSPTGNFIYELNGHGTFRIIERERLSGLLQEYKLTMTGLVDPAKGKELGKILGVDAILYINLTSVQYKTDEKKFSSNEMTQKIYTSPIGDISALSANEELTAIVDARLVSVSTGEVLAAAKYDNIAENHYSALAGIASSGNKMDRKEAVRKILDESALKLAEDLSRQIREN